VSDLMTISAGVVITFTSASETLDLVNDGRCSSIQLDMHDLVGP